MSIMAFGRRPRRGEPDPDVIAAGLGEIAAELHAYAARSPGPRAALSDRVLAALATERPQSVPVMAPVVAPVASFPLLQRLTVGLRPASFRSLLAAAILVAALGAGVALAAAGALSMHFPTLVPAEVPATRAPSVPIFMENDDRDPDPNQAAPYETDEVDGDQDEGSDGSPTDGDDGDEDGDEAGDEGVEGDGNEDRAEAGDGDEDAEKEAGVDGSGVESDDVTDGDSTDEGQPAAD